MKHFVAGILSLILMLSLPFNAFARDLSSNGDEANSGSADASAAGPSISAPSAILMDADTGTILYTKDENEERPLASVTKVMTLLLTFEALDAGKIHLDDTVTVSEHAASMGGSQVFLEPNETQTVETMIKCISVASANDACVSMAEFLAGSEDAFVEQMNEKAAELGMDHTHFVNSCGLDADGHYSTAYDIALMSRELTTRFPEIFDYTRIWMEDITHHTARGDSTFTLSNTNRLIKQYEYATGLKTGSTSKAKFCLSATATKDGVNLIAVIMAADDSKLRIADATALFNWGFANCKIFADDNTDILQEIPVTGGQRSSLRIKYQEPFRYLDVSGSSGELKKELELPDSLSAPIAQDEAVGKAVYQLGDATVGEVSILAAETIEKLTLGDAWLRLLKLLLLGSMDNAA